MDAQGKKKTQQQEKQQQQTAERTATQWNNGRIKMHQFQPTFVI